MKNDQGATRRKVLGIGVAVIGGALIAPGHAQTKKFPKAQAQYQDKPKNGQQCDACAQFVAPNGCKLVEGDIAPQGWCLYFAPKPK
jgi:hypothetical protein